MNSPAATVTDRTYWFVRSLYLFTEYFWRLSGFSLQRLWVRVYWQNKYYMRFKNTRTSVVNDSPFQPTEENHRATIREVESK